MRALITGGTGLLGSHLMRALLAKGIEVVSVARKSVEFLSDGLTHVMADLANHRALENALSQIGSCDAVFHCAAKMPTTNDRDIFQDYLAINVAATGVLLDCAASWNVRKFVYASSIGIIGKPREFPITERHEVSPPTFYHLSKYLGETTCEHYRRMKLAPTVSLRITSPYGPGMKSGAVIPKFLDLAESSRNLTLLGTGNRTQNFVHVSDVVRAAMMAMDSTATGVFNICGPHAVSMQELANAILSLLPESRSHIEHKDMMDPQEDYRWDVDYKKAEKEFGFKPQVDISPGLKSVLDYAIKQRA